MLTRHRRSSEPQIVVHYDCSGSEIYDMLAFKRLVKVLAVILGICLMSITSDVCYYRIKTFLLFMQSNVYTPNPLMVQYLLQLFQILNDIQLNVTETSINNCSGL